MNIDLDKINKESVNVMFRGTQPLGERSVFIERALKAVGSILTHTSNDVKTLNPAHSMAYKSQIGGEWTKVEYSYLTSNLSQNDVEKLISLQADRWFGTSDFTVVNIDVRDPIGERLAATLARITDGAVVNNWWDKDCYGIKPNSGVKTPSSRAIDLLVLPKGWSRLDAIALIDFMRDTIPEYALSEIDFSVSDDKKTEATMVSFSRSLRRVRNLNIKVTGNEDITLSVTPTSPTSLHNSPERDILQAVADITGGQYAACADPSENVPLDATMYVDVTGRGLDNIPNLNLNRANVLNKMLSKDVLESVVSPDDRSNAKAMLSEVVDCLSEKAGLKSQKTLEKEHKIAAKTTFGRGD